jgi:hypothetical protein
VVCVVCVCVCVYVHVVTNWLCDVKNKINRSSS